MIPEDVDSEIEKLKVRKLELETRANMTNDFNEKDELGKSIKRVSDQIETLEKLKKKF